LIVSAASTATSHIWASRGNTRFRAGAGLAGLPTELSGEASFSPPGKRGRAAFAVHLLADMLEKFWANYYAKSSPPQ
jgi:hypothetical protein